VHYNNNNNNQSTAAAAAATTTGRMELGSENRNILSFKKINATPVLPDDSRTGRRAQGHGPRAGGQPVARPSQQYRIGGQTRPPGERSVGHTDRHPSITITEVGLNLKFVRTRIPD